jgi:hypothetical protein
MTVMLPTLVQNDTAKRKLVSVPYLTEVSLLYYRTDLLQKYHFTRPPRTWSELEHQARTIQDGERANGNSLFWGFLRQGAASEALTCDALAGEDCRTTHQAIQHSDRRCEWWRQGYDFRTEPIPKLKVTGRRLDSPAAPLITELKNVAGSMPCMMVGINFPTLGCWEITGHYGDDELTLVMWVAK